VLAAVLLAACASATAHAPNLPGAQREVETYIDSGRYLEDFAKVVSRAQTWMQQQASSASRPAIVLDIDETSLSNWRAYRVNHWARILQGDCNLEKGPCNIRVWQAMGLSTAWIDRRRSKAGGGATLRPQREVMPDFTFHSLGELADAVTRT